MKKTPFHPSLLQFSAKQSLLCLATGMLLSATLLCSSADEPAPQADPRSPLSQSAASPQDNGKLPPSPPSWREAPDGQPEAAPRQASHEVFMEDLRQARPDLVERLIQLHESDPDQFRIEVRQLIHTWRILALLKQHDPSAYDAILTLWKTDEKQFKEELGKWDQKYSLSKEDWRQRFRQESGPGPSGPDRMPPPGTPDMRGPFNVSPWFSKIQELQRQHFRADTEEKKAQIAEEMQAALIADFEFRAKEYDERIARLERELSRLKEMVARRNEYKDDIIKTRLKALIGGPPMPNFGPDGPGGGFGQGGPPAKPGGYGPQGPGAQDFRPGSPPADGGRF
ncbi:MAG: hypothetical protein QM518_16155 [Verrucomicrobiota bacterium]|jgi:hypothetical protein|nr:hypothetical protein [Verrucomicrobiota bacterium]